MTHRVEAAFMNFIQNDHAVVRKVRVSQDLPEQTAICHILHHCVLSQTQRRTSILWKSCLLLCRRSSLSSQMCTMYTMLPHCIFFFFFFLNCRIFIICAAVFATHLWSIIIKTYLVADLFTKNTVHLLGYPLGHRNSSQSARDGDADFSIFTKTCTKDVEVFDRKLLAYL